jgi:biotin operon repressor/anti-sigma regulatory factor (Ser/Thr protein kinase)
MTYIRDRGEAIREFIIKNVEKHATNIIKVAAGNFSCSRQAVHKHIQRLIEEGALFQEGQTRNKTYRLATLVEWVKEYPLDSGITEDQAWREDIVPSLGRMPENVNNIWQYGFTEMFNNAIDHSGAASVTVNLRKTSASTSISLYDNGVGIFRKIQAALNLLDERHAVLELAKGKFTTDPANHSGEGIFFTSRMFDDFELLSGGVFFSHKFSEKEDWILPSFFFSLGL